MGLHGSGLPPWTDTKTCHTAESVTQPVLPPLNSTLPVLDTPATKAMHQAQQARLGFKPFRAFSPQKKRRAAPRALPKMPPTRLPNGAPGDPSVWPRLAEPIMRPDRYKMEQFVPLMRTW